MEENPYGAPRSVSDTRAARRWPFAAVVAIAGSLLALCALRFYQAVVYEAGQETLKRGIISCSVLAPLVAWAIYRLVRP